MAFGDKGMRLSVKGLALTGEQIVKLDAKDEIFVLNGGSLTSFVYNPLVSVGFSPTSTGADIKNHADTRNPNSNIMEIAGGSSIKIRYDNGICVIVSVLQNNIFHSNIKKNVARVTKHSYYTIPNGLTSATAVPYYKSGVGTSQLVPLLGLGADIVAVFEGKYGDNIVTLGDVGDKPIVGYVGSRPVTGLGGTTSIVLNNKQIPITGFGTIYRKMGRVDDISISKTIPVGSSPKVDYSARFSPAHYGYIQLHRVDNISNWAGIGKVGYVVSAKDRAYMRVSAHGKSIRTNEPDRVPTPPINDETNFVMVGGVMKEIMPDDTLREIDVVKLDGTDLIDYIYTNDMSQKLVVGSSFVEVEPFSVNGYSFGYGAGRLVDANLSAL